MTRAASTVAAAVAAAQGGLASGALANPCEIVFDREHCPDADTTLYPLAVRGVLAESPDALSPWVRVDLTSDPWFQVNLRPVDFVSDRSTAFNFAVVGVEGGIPNQTLATAYVLQDAPPGPLTAYGSVVTPGGFRLRIEIYNGNLLKASEVVLNPRWGVVTAADVDLTSCAYDPVGTGAWVEMTFDQPVLWKINTVEAVGDRIRYIDPDAGAAVDSLEWASVEGIFIREFIIDDEFPKCPGPTLQVQSTCPGNIFVRAECLTPGGQGWLFAAAGVGTTLIPYGPCAGTVLGLDSPTARLVGRSSVDADGSATFGPRYVPLRACDVVRLQVVDRDTCGMSDVVSLR